MFLVLIKNFLILIKNSEKKPKKSINKKTLNLI